MFKFKLKKFLEEQKISEAEFANKIETEESVIKDWLNGNIVPTLDDINKINIMFNLRADYFLESGSKTKKINAKIILLTLSMTFLIPSFILMFFIPTLSKYNNESEIVNFLIMDWSEPVTMWRIVLFLPGLSLMIAFLSLIIKSKVKQKKNSRKDKNTNA